jgi:hypothetical protein
MTTIETIVCPPWCVRHSACDENLGNPNGTFMHESQRRVIGTAGRNPCDQLVVNVGIVTEASGHIGPYGEALTIQIDHTTMISVETATELAHHLLSLVDGVLDGDSV